jgi:hypothetical protein
MTLTKKTTHAAEALDRLIAQFREKTNLSAVLNAYTEQTQDDEQSAWELFTERALGVAVGSQLDGIGSIVGESRDGRSDTLYELAIRAQIRLNTMSGTADEILEIIALLTTNQHTLIEYFPAGLVVVFDDKLDADPTELANNLDCAAGVRGSIEYTLADDDYTFTFADADLDQSSVNKGFVSDSAIMAVGDPDGSDAYMIASQDGSEFNELANPSNTRLRGIAQNPLVPTWVCVGSAGGVDSYLLASDNGYSFAEEGNPSNRELYDAAWSPTLSRFAAVGNVGGDPDAYIITSADGYAPWAEQSNDFPVALYTIEWAGFLSKFVALGNAAVISPYIVVSSNGTTWGTRAANKNFSIYGSCVSESLGKIVAVGQADGTDAYIIVSSNGDNWFEKSNPKNFTLRDVCWSEKLQKLVAVGAADGTDAYIVTSVDGGETWVEQSNPKNFQLNSVVYSEDLNLFFAAGVADGADAYFIKSSDGESWSEVSNPKNFNLNGIYIDAQPGGYWADAFLI